MSEEKIKINKLDGSITFINNGISFSQFGIAKEILDLITNLQQRVEQLENENEYLKMSNPEQNMEHFRIVNENKRKIDMLRKENHQLENMRKEAVEYINHVTIGADSSPVEDSWLYNLYETRYILNKGDNNVKD